MTNYLEVFSNRELALGFWFSVMLVLSLTQPRIRKSVATLVKAAVPAKLLSLYTALALYGVIVVLLLRPLGLWTASHLKDTVLWFAGVGIVSLFRVAFTKPKDHPFRSLISDGIRVAVVIEFLANIYSFPLLVEVVSIPIVVAAAVASAIAGQNPEQKSVRKATGCALSVYGLIVLIFFVSSVVQNPKELIAPSSLVSFVLPLVLTVALIPFAYLFSLWAQYETVFARLSNATDDHRLARAAKIRILRRFNLKLRSLQRWAARPNYLCVSDESDINRLLTPDPGPKSLGSVEIAAVRLEEWTNPEGRKFQMVLVDWKNTGDTPVRVVKADITPHYRRGEVVVDTGASDYVIYAVPDSQPGILPGETYREALDDGFLLVVAPGHRPPAKVEVRVTEVREDSALPP